jgi:hypothetical protein
MVGMRERTVLVGGLRVHYRHAGEGPLRCCCTGGRRRATAGAT